MHKVCHYHYFQHQAANSRIMKTHNSDVHDNNEKHSCDICAHQVSHKKSLVTHKKIKHIRVRQRCRQYNYQTTTVGPLAQHKKAVHHGVKYNTKEKYIKESNILADIAVIRQLKKEVLQNTKEQYMKW